MWDVKTNDGVSEKLCSKCWINVLYQRLEVSNIILIKSIVKQMHSKHTI